LILILVPYLFQILNPIGVGPDVLEAIHSFKTIIPNKVNKPKLDSLRVCLLKRITQENMPSMVQPSASDSGDVMDRNNLELEWLCDHRLENWTFPMETEHCNGPSEGCDSGNNNQLYSTLNNNLAESLNFDKQDIGEVEESETDEIVKRLKRFQIYTNREE
jgi:hypothetical protein